MTAKQEYAHLHKHASPAVQYTDSGDEAGVEMCPVTTNKAIIGTGVPSSTQDSPDHKPQAQHAMHPQMMQAVQLNKAMKDPMA